MTWTRTPRSPRAGQPKDTPATRKQEIDATRDDPTVCDGKRRAVKRITLGRGTRRVKLLLAGAAAGVWLGAGCGNPGSPPPGAQDRPGFALYSRHCAKCHGDDGASVRASRVKGEPFRFGDPAWADTVSLEHLERVTRVGQGRMRGLAPKLDPDEIRTVSGYVRWLATVEVPVAPDTIDH